MTAQAGMVASIGIERCLQQIIEVLGETRTGRELGLHRLRSLEDFRASLPIRSPAEHREEIEHRLGFGVFDPGGGEAVSLAGGEREREHALGVWSWLLQGRRPKRVALLRGHHYDASVDAILVDDLRAWGGELLRLHHLDDPVGVLAELESFDPEVLVVPSALTCRHLESVDRRSLEHRLRTLKLILAEHDLRRPLRTRVRLFSAGWLNRTGRLGVPTLRQPDDAVGLAVGTQVIELLAYSNPEEDARRVYETQSILPQHAIVGQRYELVCSSPLGFLRMRTGEHVRVVGFDAPSPAAPFARPRVVRLAPAPPDVRLEGCTVAGAWLTASVRQALWREDPALVQAEISPDPSSIPERPQRRRSSSLRLHEAFSDTELGSLTRTGAFSTKVRRPRAILVRIELQGFVQPELPAKLSARIDQNLRRRSPAYAHLRSRQDLLPPRVQVVSAGTRRREEERRIARLGGPVWVPEVRVSEA